MKSLTVLFAVLLSVGNFLRADMDGPVLFPACVNGDVNADWRRDITDCLYLLNALFHDGPEPVAVYRVTDLPRRENGDVNGDGRIDISDPLALAQWLFLGGPEPAPILLAQGSGGGLGLPVPGSYQLAELSIDDDGGTVEGIEPFIARDRKINLGSLGSDLWHDRGAPANDFWTITDRGPNGRVRITNPDGSTTRVRTFAIPDFAPAIIHVQTNAADAGLEILEFIPIVGS